MKLEDLFEYIVPIIFFLIYFGGALFGSKKKQEGDIDAPDSFDNTSEDELTRKIQEEIRKKIIQREHSAKKVEREIKPESAFSKNSGPFVNYQAELDKKKQQVRETQARVRALKKEQGLLLERKRKEDRATASGRGLRALLKKKQSIRDAVLLREVLEKPVGLKGVKSFY